MRASQLPQQMNESFQLSKLSKTRIQRNNVISLVCTTAAIGLAYTTSNPWIALGALYFLGFFFYRRRILRNSDPYLQLTQDGLTIHWSRDVFIPWVEMVEVTDVSKQIIMIKYQPIGFEKVATMSIVKWRLETDPMELIAQLQERIENC